MGAADHARIGVDEQHRPAIGGGDAERDAGRFRHQRIALRPRPARPWCFGDEHVRRMDLVQAEEMVRCDADMLGHAAAVLRDEGLIVVGAEPAIQRGIDAVGDAALAGEEGMAQAGHRRQQRGSKRHEASPVRSKSLRPASPVNRGSEMPSTLNIEPMPLRPVSVSRLSATEMSVATSGVAFCIRAAARVSMPTRLRKSPCVTGPCTRAPTSSAARASAWKSTWAVTSAWPGAFSGSVKVWRAMAWKVSPASLRRWP